MPPSGALAASCAPASGAWAAWAAPVGGKAAGLAASAAWAGVPGAGLAVSRFTGGSPCCAAPRPCRGFGLGKPRAMGCGAPARFGQREAPCYPMRVRRATRRAPNPPNPENAGALRIRRAGSAAHGAGVLAPRPLQAARPRKTQPPRLPVPVWPWKRPPWRVAPSCASAPAPCAPRNGAARPSVPGVAAAPACLPCAPANGRRVRAEDIGR